MATDRLHHLELRLERLLNPLHRRSLVSVLPPKGLPVYAPVVRDETQFVSALRPLTPTTSASDHHYEEESCEVVRLVVGWPSLM
jgi:hypothetical protein